MKERNNRKKKRWSFYGIPLTADAALKALYIIAVFIAVCILSDAFVLINDSFLVTCSLAFLILSAVLLMLAHRSEISDKDYQIANLKQEIKKLEDIRGSNEFIIELLEKELDKHTIAHTTNNNKKE